jgi:hypothetical protein
MTRGVLIFAHNNRDVDYALLALIAGSLAKKNLGVPVSLVTDDTTVEWMKTSMIYEKAIDVFDKIIIVEKPVTDNTRRLHDGHNNKVVPFVNSNRSSAWHLTPYDQTLLIDSDFLIFSNRLNEYWDVKEDVMISESMKDIFYESRAGYHDWYISDTGIPMLWATTVMFTKNARSCAVFDMIEYVRTNYQHYADIFRFDHRQYRNDISFSVASHILAGFESNIKTTSLPPVLTTIDRDILDSVDKNGKLTLLISSKLNDKFYAATTCGLDLHIMNKQSIIRNAESLLTLI